MVIDIEDGGWREHPTGERWLATYDLGVIEIPGVD